MNVPETLKYTKSHEWLKEEADGSYTMGLTDYAQKQLGDIVFVNLPMEGDPATAGEAVADVFSPVTGTVAAVNEDLMDEPQQINQAPYEAWIAKISDVTDTEELLTAAEYADFCEKAKG